MGLSEKRKNDLRRNKMSKANNEIEEITKKYIVNLLELQETKLESVNLGFYQSPSIKMELDLIKRAKETSTYNL